MSAHTRIPLGLVTALIPFAAPATVSGAPPEKPGDVVPLEAATMIIELNSTDLDIGIQFFLDSDDGWKSVEISNPAGEEIFEVESHSRLTRQGGGTELFMESNEPTLDELPLAVFFNRFPEGTYTFRGRSVSGDTLVGRAEFTHVLPAGPVLVTPVPRGGEKCATDVAIPTPIAWEPVTTTIFGDPLEVVQYEVVIEGEDSTFDVHIPASAGTQVTVPAEVLHPGTEYSYEVLAIEEGGNQTISETCFVTAE
jgi:hypothetical protein